ncbi:uncharacterized protein [Amphiura filiformis]|uniref:uncharacterized protein n=1 Tax=Amphiura filiformis TaxID=82378 RepID=UPI003B21C6D4
MSIYDCKLLGGKCSDPSPPHGSTVEQDFSFGKWVTFVCDPDYVLIGETTLQCVLGNTPDHCTWSDEPPQCESLLHSPPSTALISSASLASSNPYSELWTGVSQSKKVSQEPPTRQRSTHAIPMDGSRNPQQAGLSTGVIAGSVVGCLLVLILILLLFLFLIKSRLKKQQSTSPKDINLVSSGTQQDVIYSNQHQPEYACVTSTNLSQPDKNGPIPESSPNDDSYIIIYADADDIDQKHSPKDHPTTKGTDNNDTQENSLYYATSDQFTRQQQQDSADDDNGEGWEDNVAYISFDGNAKNEEGWEENSLYSMDK